MFVTKKAVSRRTVLRGIGASLALPLLDAMCPAFTAIAKGAGAPVHRFQTYYFPNGMAMEYWTPATVGRGFELTPVLAPLASFREQMTVITGLRSSWNAVHAGASTSFLSGATHGGRTQTELLAGTTIDQALAAVHGKQTPLASLEVSLDNKGNAGECSADLSCAYVNTISWKTPTLPLPMENNPRAIFERMFGDAGTTEPGARMQRLRQSRSILDSVGEKLTALRATIGAGDQLKVAEYTDAVRDIERQIQRTEEQNRELPVIEQPRGVPTEFEDHLRLLFDLKRLALQTDLTRVITFMLAREQSGRMYPKSGVSDAHHAISHHANDPEKIRLMSKINTYHATLFAEYLGKLRDTPDGDGSLLDHTTILYGGGLSNSTSHSGVSLPIVLVGGGAGTLKGGQHLKYAEDTSMANLLVALMDKQGMPVQTVGNSTGELDIDSLPGL